MGRFAKYARKVLQEKMAADGVNVEEAARRIQTSCQKAIDEREEEIKNIKRIYGDPPDPPEWQRVVGDEQFYIALEREWMVEFDSPKSLLNSP